MSSGVGIRSWRDLSLSEAEALLEVSHDLSALQNKLFEIVKTRKNSVAIATKQLPALEVELYSHMVVFTREVGLSSEQLSALFSILKDIHCVCISSPYDNSLEGLQLFHHLMLCHSVNHPPHYICLFNLAQVKLITEYILNTYFRHYKLYKFAFTKRMCLDVQVGSEGLSSEVGLAASSDTSSEAVNDEKTSSPTVDESSEEYIEEESSEVCSPLQLMIAAELSEKMKELKVSVEKELTNQEQKMAARLSALEKTSLSKFQTK